ncbi:type VII secretion-associated protein [Gordonia sp. NPDC003424]
MRSTSPTTRPTVVDLAYGQVRIDATRCADVTGLLDAVDAPTVLVDGTPRYNHQAWQGVWRDLGLPERDGSGPRPLIVGHPSTWGRRRASVLARSAADLGVPVTLVGRAVLIARSHTDPAVERCVVVETTQRPTVATDPARPSAGWWSATRLRRTAAGWEIEASDVLEPGADDIGPRTETFIDDSVEMVLVDGDDRGDIAHAVDVVATHALAGRVIPVDRDMIARYGWRTGRADASDDRVAPPIAPTEDSPPRRRRSGTWIAAAGAVAVVVAVVAGVIGFLQRGDDAAHPQETVTIGRTSLAVPADWRRSELGAGTPDASRIVFAGRDDGRRILVVQSEVRSDSTLASVATSLTNRIRQRGDDVVTEFSSSTRFMGRDVISYREAPASGSGIRWYVLVDDALQVSIGCQAGTAGQSVDRECQTAVSSARIAPPR